MASELFGIAKKFWAELLSRQISKSEFQNEVTKRNLSYISQDQFLIIQIVFLMERKIQGFGNKRQLILLYKMFYQRCWKILICKLKQFFL